MGYFPPFHIWEYLTFYVFFAIPLGFWGVFLGFKDGFIGFKTKRQKIMFAIVVVIFAWYVFLHSYLHFVLPYRGIH